MFLLGGPRMAEQIHILCDLELKQLATAQAREDGISLSAWICRLMEEGLDRPSIAARVRALEEKGLPI